MFRMRNNIVGTRVRAARIAYRPRMTQSDLAIKLQLDSWDIGRSGVAKIELGLRTVTDVEVAKLAKALGVSIAWLFDPDASPLSSEAKECT